MTTDKQTKYIPVISFALISHRFIRIYREVSSRQNFAPIFFYLRGLTTVAERHVVSGFV